MESIFIEFSLLIIIALIVSAAARALKQPLIIGYIVAGILVSPSVFNLLKSSDNLSVLSQLGVAVLLFMVGLHLNPKIIKEVGKVALITGIGQILFTFVLGFLISHLLGFGFIEGAYISLALAFSSTIIIMKLLSDKGDVATLYGKISIGFLIVQDLVAILALMIVSSLGEGVNLSSLAMQKIVIGAGLTASLLLIGIYILPRLTKTLANNQELLLLFSIGWAMALASLFDLSGFSIEIGALLAGITLSSSPYRYEIGIKMTPLRDFFLLIFFLLLGSQLSFGDIGNHIWAVIIFSLVVFVGNPLIVMFLMGRIGYTKRTGFLAGLTVSQISEFSFILVALGISYGHIGSEILSITTMVGLITMAGSSYGIIYSRSLYNFFADWLRIFERKDMRKLDEGKYHVEENYDVMLFGHNRIGFDLLRSLKSLKKKVLVVDFNPDIVLQLARRGIDARYGDANDIELLEDLDFSETKMIISTIPEISTNLLLIRKLERVNRNMIFIVIAHQIDEAIKLYDAGATYVILPHFLGGVHTASLIEKHGMRLGGFMKEKMKHRKELMLRKKEGQKHPSHERG